jgi:hypothetical protein
MTLPSIPSGQGRIIFFRGTSALGSAVGADVHLNDTVVGRSAVGTFFFVDRDPGNFEVTCATEMKHKLTLALSPQETKYIQTTVTMGVFVGQIWPNLVDEKTALADIKDCTYTGPPLPGQSK